jgi:hypothetical protein
MAVHRLAGLQRCLGSHRCVGRAADRLPGRLERSRGLVQAPAPVASGRQGPLAHPGRPGRLATSTPDQRQRPAVHPGPRPPARRPRAWVPDHALQRETLPLADRARLQRPAWGEPGLEHIEIGLRLRLDQRTVLRPDDGALAGEVAGEFAGRRAGHPGLAPWCAGCGHAEPPGERPPHADRHPGAAHRRPCPARRWPPSAGRLQCQQAVPGARAVGRRRLVA